MKHSWRLFGLDVYKTTYTIEELANLCKSQKIELYELEEKEEGLIFYAPFYQQKKLKQQANISYLKSTGLFGFLLRQIKQRRKRFLLYYLILLWSVLLRLLIGYEISGADDAVKTKLLTYLQEQYPSQRFYWNFDAQQVKKELTDAFLADLSWLEVRKDGLTLHVSFLARHYGTTEEMTSENLYASKDALIAYYLVQHGEMQVKKDDFVRAGDLLVRNYLVDPFQKEKNLYVKGRVYGYTWYTVDRELKEQPELIRPLAFFRLLLDCRNQIAQQIQEDEKIIEETVLHFTISSGTIKMRVQYMLLEEITRP